MTDLPEWLPADLSNPKLETIGPIHRLRGRDADPEVAMGDFLEVVDLANPPGYIFSRAFIKAQHARGRRLTWEVIWTKKEEADQRYQDKQAARMSRYEVQT